MTLQLVQPHLHPGIGKLPPERRPFNILQDYVEDRLSLDETVERITRPVEELYDHDYSNAYVLLGFTWRTLDSIIRQIPYDHDGHRKLANLLVSIKHRHSPEGDNARSFAAWEGQLWKDLPLFEPGLGGVWSSATQKIMSMTGRAVDIQYDTLGEFGGPAGIRQQYMSWNAFLSRLASIQDAPEWDIYGLMVFRWALEDDLNAEGLSLNVPGAVMWIFYAGEHIWKSEREWVVPFTDLNALETSRGSLMWDATKKNGFCEERWVLWRDSFGWVADMEEVSDETRELATLAYERMRWIEENVPRS